MMGTHQKMLLTKTLVVLTYLGMIAVNALANALPINGVTTGGVSDAYPNLFAPAGLTFSIWGLIYILLGAYTLYQLGLFRSDKSASRVELFQDVGLFFIISSLANMSWIFAWHYDYIAISLVLMIVILLCLIVIAQRLAEEQLSLKEKFFIRLPFSIYFGWITVATIANVTTFLVSIGWDGFGIADQAWAVAVIIAGVIIAIATMLRNKDLAYGLVVVWAYAGILIKHISPAEFAGQYPSVIVTASFCIILLLIAGVSLSKASLQRQIMGL